MQVPNEGADITIPFAQGPSPYLVLATKGVWIHKLDSDSHVQDGKLHKRVASKKRTSPPPNNPEGVRMQVSRGLDGRMWRHYVVEPNQWKNDVVVLSLVTPDSTDVGLP